MDIIKLSQDLGEMQDYEPLPAGPYRAELRDVEIKTSEKVPQGYLYCQYRIDPSDFPVDYDVQNAPEGLNVIYARISLPSAQNRRANAPFKNFLKAHGLEAAGSEFALDQFRGKEVQVILSKSEYNGAPVNNVEGVLALPSV